MSFERSRAIMSTDTEKKCGVLIINRRFGHTIDNGESHVRQMKGSLGSREECGLQASAQVTYES